MLRTPTMSGSTKRRAAVRYYPPTSPDEARRICDAMEFTREPAPAITEEMARLWQSTNARAVRMREWVAEHFTALIAVRTTTRYWRRRTLSFAVIGQSDLCPIRTANTIRIYVDAHWAVHQHHRRLALPSEARRREALARLLTCGEDWKTRALESWAKALARSPREILPPDLDAGKPKGGWKPSDAMLAKAQRFFVVQGAGQVQKRPVGVRSEFDPRTAEARRIAGDAPEPPTPEEREPGKYSRDVEEMLK